MRVTWNSILEFSAKKLIQYMRPFPSVSSHAHVGKQFIELHQCVSISSPPSNCVSPPSLKLMWVVYVENFACIADLLKARSFKTHTGMTIEPCLTVISLHHMRIEIASPYLLYQIIASLGRVRMILHAVNVYAMHRWPKSRCPGPSEGHSSQLLCATHSSF